MTRHNHFVTVVLEIVREPGKSGGAIGFALNFLWLLSLFQDKESKSRTFLSKQSLHTRNNLSY